MKNIVQKKFLVVGSVLAILGLSCKKSELASLNTKPGNLTSAPPASLYLNAINNSQGNFEYYYDFNRFLFPIAQIFTNNGSKGVSNGTLTDGNSNQSRYSRFFSTGSGVGNYTVDAERSFYNFYTPDQQALRVSWVPIFRILKIYYALNTSDVYGNIPYTQAFKAKEGILQPSFDSQQNLFDTLNAQLKSAADILKTVGSNEQTLGEYDQFYGTKTDEVKKWIKAANALRLRLAMRLMKRDPAKLASIASEVLADPSGIMSDNDDSWLFQPIAAFWGGSGNWDPLSAGAKGIKGTIDFMWNNQDPRLRNFYQQNNYSQANISAAIAAGKLSAGTVEPARRYVGSYASPDAVNSPANERLYTTTTVNSSLTLDTLSTIQDRLISPYNNDGGGRGTFVLISYADVCFMRAELAARGITNEDAKALYEAGITASIQMYDGIAKLATVYNYTPLGAGEAAAYLASPDVAYNSSKALEQITTQAYINFFLQPNEAWALIKRTGFPNATTSLVYETFKINGSPSPYPRRYSMSVPSQADDNYVNEKASMDAMIADPDFGVPGDNSGRVWWDKK